MKDLKHIQSHRNLCCVVANAVTACSGAHWETDHYLTITMQLLNLMKRTTMTVEGDYQINRHKQKWDWDKPDNSQSVFLPEFMACSECSIIWTLTTARSLWITHSSSLMLVSLINGLEQVHIKELPIYDHLWQPYFISRSCSRYHSPL